MNYLIICVISAFVTITLSHESRGEIPRAPFYFFYKNGDNINVEVVLKNMPDNMDFRIYPSCSSIFKDEIVKKSDFFSLQSTLWCQETIVSIELLNNKRSYKNITILEGKDDQIYGKIADQRFEHNNKCLDNDQPCIIELDLDRIFTDSYINNPITRVTETTKFTNLSYSEFESNFTTLPYFRNNVPLPHYGNNTTPSPHYRNNATPSPHYGNNATPSPHYGNNERTSAQTINDTNGSGEQRFSQTYIYVIVSVIAICVVLFVTCICIKKYRHRNKQPVKTMELNTYVTANDVIYADLGLAQGDTQPPRHDEESPYAQIIGVMRPDVK